MKIAFALALALLITLSTQADDQAKRPPIVGISHIALYVQDIEKSRAFYKDLLGFAEPYSLPNADGSLHLTWIKINDHQTIELFPEKEPGSDRLYHIALETPDAQAMRDYLAAKGWKVPEKVGTGKIGNKNYFVDDPNGRIVEIVEYQENGWTMLNKGKFLPDTRIATRMPHVGILCGDLDAAKHFYEDILGFREIWRGSKNSTQLSWVHVQVPDAKDFIELMLYSDLPDADKRGKYHHLCLEVPDVQKAKATLEARAAKVGYTRTMDIQVGVNRKRQLNLWDPDGTRVELMEPGTIDGVAAQPSTAPAPHPSTKPTTQPQQAMRKVLFFSKSSNFEHAVIKRKDAQPSFVENVLSELGPKHGIEFSFSKDGSLFSPEYLTKFDAFMFYTSGDLLASGKDGNPPMTAQGKTALLDAIRNGKGFIGVHSATDTFHTGETADTDTDRARTWRYRNLADQADPYTRMIGAEFIVHSVQQTAHMKVADAKFPGLQNCGERFDQMDEWYSLTDFSKDLHVLLVQQTGGMTGVPYKRPPYPATWAHPCGKGRVFYTSMGHREDVWTSPRFQEILLGALDWTTGKVNADITPNINQVTPDCQTLPPVSPPVPGDPAKFKPEMETATK